MVIQLNALGCCWVTVSCDGSHACAKVSVNAKDGS